MDSYLFLCRACYPSPGEVVTKAIPTRACDYCGAQCSNLPSTMGLPPGDLVYASAAPPPRALSRAEAEARIMAVPVPSDHPALMALSALADGPTDELSELETRDIEAAWAEAKETE